MERLPSLKAIRETLIVHHADYMPGGYRHPRPFAKHKQNARMWACGAIRKGGYKAGSKAHSSIGCLWPEFKRHLERQFTKGMTWNNYGAWHLDHRIPLAQAQNEQELNYLLHYMNLQPLWARDNMVKSDEIPPCVQLHLAIR